MKNSEIELAIFYCNHQAEETKQILKALDCSGNMRIRKIALPCSGKLEVIHLTKALESGADGVALCGCQEKECHYQVGSQRAKGRVRYAGKILEEIGLEKDRIRRFIFSEFSLTQNLDAFREWIEKVKAMGTAQANPKIKMQN